MVNKKLLTTALIATCATITQQAYADNTWYIGAQIDSVDISSINTASEPLSGVARRIDIDSDSDTGFGLKFGKTLFTTQAGHKFNIELSYTDSEHDIENIAFMSNDFLASEGLSEGSIELKTVMLRALYQFNLGAISPYVGIGVGQVDFNVDGRYGMSVGQGPQTRPPFADGNDSASAVQYRIGAEYHLTSHLGLFIEYSATDVDDIEFSRRGNGPGGLATTTQTGDFDFDTLSVGMNYHF